MQLFKTEIFSSFYPFLLNLKMMNDDSYNFTKLPMKLHNELIC